MTTRPDAGIKNPRVLAIATVGQSLRFQAPDAWDLLARRGFDVTYAAAPDQWSPELALQGAFEPIRVGRDARLSSLVSGSRDVRRLAAQHWALIQVQSPIVAALARTSPRNCPLIYVAHGFHFHRDGGRIRNLLYGSVEWALAGRGDALAVVCREDFDAAVTLGLHRRTLLWHLPGAGVDLDRFPATPRRPARPLHLLFVGELNENKAPLLVADLVHHLGALGHDVVATIVGDGPLRDAVSARVKALPKQLRWVPHTSSPARFFQECDIVVAPSAREGLPRTVIEAISTGRPVVARSNRGTRELLTDPVHGRLLSATAPLEHWADAVLDVAGSSARQVESRHASVQRFGKDAFALSYGQLIDRVLTGDGRPGAVDLLDQRGSKPNVGGA